MNSLIEIFNKLDTYNTDVFVKIYAHQANHYNSYHEIVDKNVTIRPMTTKRKVLYCLHLLISSFQLVKYMVLNFNHEPWVQVMFGDLLFLFVSKYAKLNAFWLVTVFFSLLTKLVILYYEYDMAHSPIKVIIDLIRKSKFFKLTKKNENKLILRTNVLYWLYMRFAINFGLFLVIIVYVAIGFAAYFFTDYHFTVFNLIVLVIATIFQAVGLKTGINGIVGGVLIIFILTNFLEMKLGEIGKSILVNIRWRNKVRLIDDMRQYEQFIKVLNVISNPINKAIGLGYMILPFMSTQVLEVFVWNAVEPAEKLLRFASMLAILITLLHLIMLNYYAALLARRNKSMHKYFYMVICDKAFHRAHTTERVSLDFSMRQLSNIKFIMKVDSFIARLSKQNIGFRMLNVVGVTIKILKMNTK